ncbi:MAG: hypothetical protein AB1793_00210 [Candidatus Thermoplasmatota archaeon]
MGEEDQNKRRGQKRDMRDWDSKDVGTITLESIKKEHKKEKTDK